MEILARCGFRCDLCPAYNPNIKSPDDREKVSEKWQKYFGFYLPPDKIGCNGCIGNSQPLDTECPVRPCVNNKSIENCAYCNDFICDKLKTRIDALVEVQNKITGIPEDDYVKYLAPFDSKRRLSQIRNNLK